MHKIFGVAAALAVAAYAQAPDTRRAVITGGNEEHGKCTIEVVVDSVAEVEVRGDMATIRTLSGQRSYFRRFQCNRLMPANPPAFRFEGVDGRGRQTLVRDPGRGGVAVVHIEDPKSGSEGYTFDLIWGGHEALPPPPPPPPPGPGPGDRDRGERDRGDRDRGDRGDFPVDTAERAVRGCREAIRDRAADQLNARDIDFRRINVDDAPGRRDWVIGVFEVRRGPEYGHRYRFSCSVNLDTGRVRSADFQREDR